MQAQLSGLYFFVIKNLEILAGGRCIFWLLIDKFIGINLNQLLNLCILHIVVE